jgi:hypothetical protein
MLRVTVPSSSVLLVLMSCNADRGPAPAASASAAAVPSAVRTGTVEPTPAADDLDAAPLKQALKCASDAKKGPCGVLAAFSTCTAWSGTVPSGDGRWLGRGFRVDGGKTTEQFTIVRAKTVPSSEVGPGQLPVKIGIAEIANGDGNAYDQADRAVRALERRDVPPRQSPTIEFVKNKSEWPEASATRTKSGQIYVIAQGGGFVCQGPEQRLLVVQRATSIAANADGLYAELWPTTW